MSVTNQSVHHPDSHQPQTLKIADEGDGQEVDDLV